MRIARTGRLARGVPAMVAAGLLAATLAGGAGRAAAQQRGSAVPPGASRAAAPWTVSTAAGGVGGPGLATGVSLATDCGVSSAGGSVYVADGGSVRMVNASGHLTTPAGTGAAGPAGNGGPAAQADLFTCGASADSHGNVLVADSSHYEVRVAAAKTGTFYGEKMTAGHVYAVAGNGTRGVSGSGGVATAAELSGPQDVITDDGNLVLADRGFQQPRSATIHGSRLQVVAARTGEFFGQAMTAGHIYPVAGQANGGTNSGDGGPALKAGISTFIQGVQVDGAGNLILADTGDYRVRMVAAVSGTFYGLAMTAGDIYTVAGNGNYGYSGDGGPATSAEIEGYGVAVDGAGNLLIADGGNDRIRVVAASTGRFYGQAMTTGDIYTVAGNGTAGDSGDGGPATSAELNNPQGVAVDAAGNLVIADYGNYRVRVVAAVSGTFYGQAMTAGDIYTVAGNGEQEYSGDGGKATSAEFDAPDGVAADGAGNLLIADTGSNVVRMVAAKAGTFYGQPMAAGDIYTVAGDGTTGFAGDGNPAIYAELDSPDGVALDGAGNLVIADSYNNRIRVVAARTGTFYGQAMTAGHIYTVAGDGHQGNTGNGGPATSAGLYRADSVVVDAAGNLVIPAATEVRVVAAASGTFYGQAMTAGDIYSVAGNGTAGDSGNGGPATSAELDFPQGVATDAAGNLVIADTYNSQIRVVAVSTGTFYGLAMTADDIYAVAGEDMEGFSGDGGPATSAEMDGPLGVAVDSAGNLVITDSGNSRIRVVAATTGTFYGLAMTADDIYTVAGDGVLGYSGDGGPATSAGVPAPASVIVNHAGNLLFTDLSGRVRTVTG